MDIHEAKKFVGVKLPLSTLRAIKKGRVKVNVSAEVRRLIDLGLQAEAAQVK